MFSFSLSQNNRYGHDSPALRRLIFPQAGGTWALDPAGVATKGVINYSRKQQQQYQLLTDNGRCRKTTATDEATTWLGSSDILQHFPGGKKPLTALLIALGKINERQKAYLWEPKLTGALNSSLRPLTVFQRKKIQISAVRTVCTADFFTWGI